jgi:hypothetical protein
VVVTFLPHVLESVKRSVGECELETIDGINTVETRILSHVSYPTTKGAHLSAAVGVHPVLHDCVEVPTRRLNKASLKIPVFARCRPFLLQSFGSG